MTKEVLLPLLLENRELNKKQEKSLRKLFGEIAAKSVKDRDAEDWFILGYVESRDENYEEAIDTFTFSIEKNPEFEAAYRFRASAYMFNKEYKSARADIDKALKIDPEYVDALFESASLNLEEKKWKEAIADADKVIELEPDHLPAKMLKAKAQYDSGDYDEAVKSYSVILEEDPKNAEALSSRGLAYFFNADYEKADADIRKGRMYERGNIVSEFNMGLVTSAFPEKSKESYRHFEKAFRKDGKLLLHYIDNAAVHESERLISRLTEIFKEIEKKKEENFYTRELHDLLERKLKDASLALEEKKKQ